MAVNLGSVYMTLQTKFNEGEFGKKIGHITGKLQQIGKVASVVGAAIGGMLAVGISKFASEGDAIHKMGIRTGMTAEALGELAHAAQLGGTSIEALEPGFKKMAMFIDGARDGAKISTDTLTKLGLDIKDFAGLNPDQTFMKLAEAISNIKDPLAQAAIASDIFGRSGTAMLPMLSGGIEGLRQAREEAIKFGRITTEEANSAAAYTDAMYRLKTSMAELTEEVVSKLVPALTPLVEQLALNINSIREWVGEHETAVTTTVKWGGALWGLSTVLGWGSKMIGVFASAWKGLSVVLPFLKGFGATMTAGLMSPLGLLVVGVGALLLSVITHWDEFKLATKLIWDDLRNYFSGWIDWFKGIIKNIWEGFKDLASAPVDAAKGAVNAVSNAIGLGQVFDTSKSTVPSSVPNPTNVAPTTNNISGGGLGDAINKAMAAQDKGGGGNTINVHQANFSQTDAQISNGALKGALVPAT